MIPALTKWYDRRDFVCVEFCVADSKDVKVNFDKTKLGFSCVGPDDDIFENKIDLYLDIDENDSKHKRTDRSVLCFLQKAEVGMTWPRLTKEKTRLCWLCVDFNNWKDWDDDSDEELTNFDQLSNMMDNMKREDDGNDDYTDDEDTFDSDDDEMPDLE
ncbi:prostaglandin E synthase 3b isoform X1 [Poecilia latipinna]|uniref:Prostaglandin E synthase 3 n=1 Tax=Poecilia latipinna TaxID=48699 RepID=A0A3B3V941_9TELE|nr:PREDICTED: prostaglandin E synthase 3 isoform X1 [Poecilia latipinna]